MPDDAILVTHAAGRYPVRVDRLDALPTHLAAAGLTTGRALVVTDETVAGLHLGALLGPLREAGWTLETLAVAPGERSKSLGTYRDVTDWALGLGITRATPLMAFGGGVVGDLGGFAAATLLRGIPLVQVPTTTIAQVDSAIGGKTGINTAAGKNLVGAFWAPRLVLTDPSLLTTLPDADYRSGLAEAVKHALLSGDAAVDRLAGQWDGLVGRDLAVVRDVVARAARVKADVVSADEREGGQRAFLNLGHTFGHAVERVAGYGAVTHGAAVALGLLAALHLSRALRPGAADPFRAAEALVQRLPLPALGADVDDRDLVTAMATDKKRGADGLRFVVLDAPGAPRLAGGVPAALVLDALAYARARAQRGRTG